MNTAYLATLLAVHRCGSMAQAARELNVTHGAVAQQLHALSVRLGRPMVTRAGKTVVLTPAAYRILQQAQAILDQVDALTALAHKDQISGELKLGAGNTALVSTLPGILATLIDNYPQLRVSVTPGASTQFYPKVESGALDTAIALMPPFDIPKRLGWCLLTQEPFTLIAPVRHAARQVHDLLRQEPFIRYSRRGWDSQAIDGYLKAIGVTPRERLELSSTESIAMMVDKGLGVAIVPSVWTLWQSRVNVVAMPLPGPAPTRSFGLIWDRSSVKLPLVNVFRQVAEREYQR